MIKELSIAIATYNSDQLTVLFCKFNSWIASYRKLVSNRFPIWIQLQI